MDSTTESSEKVDNKAPAAEPVVSLSTFLLGTGGVFSLALLIGIRRAFKQDDIELKATSRMAKIDFSVLSKAEQEKIAAKKMADAAKLGITLKKTNPSSLSPWKFFAKNQSGVSLAFRAFLIGSALCFSTFSIGTGVFLYANNLKTTDDVDRYLRQRMKTSFLGRMMKANDMHPVETAEVEKWFEDLFENPWQLLESTKSTNKIPTSSSKKEVEKIDTVQAIEKEKESESTGGIAAVLSYKWQKLLFKVGLGEDPGAPPAKLQLLSASEEQKKDDGDEAIAAAFAAVLKVEDGVVKTKNP